MTNKEAIEILKQSYPSQKEILSGEYPHIAEAYDLAIQALEKQEPKKVNNTTSYKYSGECLMCGALVGAGEKYCDYCGQKLDWSKD